MITQNTIDEIFNTAKIEEVVGDFVYLKKRGANYTGLCPFHNEKTPSFVVSPAKGIYKCFGCGESGNAVSFIMKHEQLAYPEALKYLAEKYKIEIEETEQTDEQKQQQSKRESLYLVSQFANQWFQEQLHNTDEGKAIGLSYFKERGFSDETIKTFQLGYSPSGKDNFTKAALEKGYNLEYLTDTGLTIQKGDYTFDRFHNRVMFPIHNLSGRVIGFGGRVLKKNEKTAKYLNSPESEIYHKSKIVYGIYFAKKAITQEDNCYLVEGYTDVISLYQKGVHNVVASSGTSLTEDQIRLIKRYTQNITILYDGDPAGIKASFRGIDMILAEDMNVKVLLFPEGEDPDSFAQKHNTEELKSYLKENTSDFLQFRIKIQQDEFNNDPIKKVELLNDIANSISIIPDAIKRSVYTKECATLLDVPEQALISEINKKIRKKLNGKVKKHEQEIINKQEQYAPLSKNEKQIATINRREFWEREIVRLLCNYATEPVTVEIEMEPDEENLETEPKKQTIQATAAEWILKELHDDNIELSIPVYNEIINYFKQKIVNGESFSTQALINHPDESISKTVIDLLAEKHELSENWKKHNIFISIERESLNQSILQTLKFFKLEFIAEEIRQLQSKLKTTENPEDLMDVLNQIKIYTDIKKRLAKELGVTVM
jgi:DNA primase